MSEALFGFLGIIIGATVSLLGEQFTTRREREARQAAREQERKDRRDASNGRPPRATGRPG